MISKNILIKSNNTKKMHFQKLDKKKKKKNQISNFNFHDTSKK